ncbi:MAG: SHOCT domain-containing protein [Thermoplasmata archaeon]
MDKELLDKLEERLAKGEISEETYKEIKARYESKDEIEVEEPEDEEMEELEDVEMEEGGKKTKKVTLTGASKIEGCNCEYFKSAGASKIEGNMKADEARIHGATKVTGDAKIGLLDSSGSIKVNGKTNADQMNLSGASKFMNIVDAKKIDSSGATKFMEDVKSDEFISSGSMKAEKNIDAKTFTAAGAFVIQGTLKANEIMLKPGGKCEIGKIHGGDVLVETGSGGFFSFGKSGSLKVDEVKGDDIYLENTRAKLVEGDNVKIGPGCKIEKVRAKSLKVHESSSIDKKETLNE